MRRYTQPYTGFLERLQEVRLLQRLASKRNASIPVEAAERTALCRGAVVLISSHVEGYVKELGELALERLYSRRVARSKISRRILYHVSKSRIDVIRSTPDREALIPRIEDFISVSASLWNDPGSLEAPLAADEFGRGFASPNFSKIRTYFSRFGYDDFRADFYRVLRSRAQVVENSLNHLVDTRNNIAHGDVSAIKEPSDIKIFLYNMKLFCRVTDDIFARWCRGKYCSIR